MFVCNCRKQFNIDVLHQFVSHHKFHGLDLVGALRSVGKGCGMSGGKNMLWDRLVGVAIKVGCFSPESVM